MRLELLARVWIADGQFAPFFEWLARTEMHFQMADFDALAGRPAPDVFHRPTKDLPTWELETSARRRGRMPTELDNPFTGGWDPLHLTTHHYAPLDQPPGDVMMVHTDRRRRRAVLVVDSMVGFYGALAEAGSSLPELGNRSWHVDVFSRPVGFLGTYRRSRETGIWFAGRHRYHTLGAA